MTTVQTTRPPRNGVDVPTLFATLDAVKANPGAARFQFRATNTWVSGTHSRGTISGYYGVFDEQQRDRSFAFDADHPATLVGNDNGPTPTEFVLHALGACLTAGIVNIASAKGIDLTEVTATVVGDIDLNGVLGLDPEVRNGYEQIHVTYTVRGDASDEQLRDLVEASRARSAVFDVLTGQVPVTVEAEVG